jgi:hypothetical protein
LAEHLLECHHPDNNHESSLKDGKKRVLKGVRDKIIERRNGKSLRQEDRIDP